MAIGILGFCGVDCTSRADVVEEVIDAGLGGDCVAVDAISIELISRRPEGWQQRKEPQRSAKSLAVERDDAHLLNWSISVYGEREDLWWRQG